MKSLLRLLVVLGLGSGHSIAAVKPAPGDSPADHLPAHIRRVTGFGERADWSHDGRRILFLSKTYGDAMELDLATNLVRNCTAHYAHHGYTRALYLSNGDILLAGPAQFDPARAREARTQCWLYVLDRSGTKPPVPLGTKCSEGPAVSRRHLRIAWTHVAAQYPAEMPAGSSRMQEAEIVYDDGKPRLANQRLILDSRDLPFKCTLETQNYRPPQERELTFSAYGHQGTDVAAIDLTTRKVVNYSNAPDQYDEPEGIFPDGNYTLVESDKQNRKGSGHVDLWKLKLDGSGTMERLTFFSDYPGFKASNPVVSDDGRYIAFQMAKSTEAAGVGHGLFVLDLTKAPAATRPPTAAISDPPGDIAQWTGQHGGGNAPGTRVLRTAAEWTAFWQQAAREAPRPVDEQREMAVVISLGEKRTGGYSAKIIGARGQDNQLIVEYQESAPAAGMMVTQALTQPWVIAVVPRSDLPVVARRLGSPRSLREK